ncbi:UDP-N-acetylglucosamine 2-epimerase (non-hydrolyzing) [Rhodobacteraceae bacterium RKSG542]|nr:UDP-N-acetylglucosamine 2-epimerase (non-hydrolyzing) [Pseudovibrio flavus]
MAPVINALNRSPVLYAEVVLTGQHKDLVSSALALFGIINVHWLPDERTDHSLSAQASGYLKELGVYFERSGADYVLVHGDTTSGMVGALAAFYARIPVAHVEAGLRSGSLKDPFPEEANRQIIDRICDHLFAPTRQAAEALLAEGIDASKISITGNTVVDAALEISRRTKAVHEIESLKDRLPEGARFILVTAHRRENWGEPLCNICRAIIAVLEQNPDIYAVLPVHQNPNVSSVILDQLSGIDRLLLVPSLGYKELIALQQNAELIMTDSGGIQEEAPSFNTPVLVMRNTTERPEAIEAGCAQLVGTDTANIIAAANNALSGVFSLEGVQNPFGDGTASDQIVACVEAALFPHLQEEVA